MRLLLVLTLFLVSASCTNRIPKEKIETDQDKSLYVFGSTFAAGLKSIQLNEDESEIVMRGFIDAAMKTPIEGVLDVSRDEKIKEFFANRKYKTDLVESKKAGKIYLEEFLKNGGKKTASGVAYQIYEPGEGLTPQANDKVDIHYNGVLASGGVFGSTLTSNKPFRVTLKDIVPGWSEGIQLLKPGGRMKLVIPPELAYGDQGAPPKIPPGATLVIEMGLLGIVK